MERRSMMRNSMQFALGLVGLALAGAAHAQTAGPPAAAPSLGVIAWTTPPKIDLADPRLSLATPYAQRATDATPGMPKTAIDHRFASEDLVGAVGYLCGLQSGPNEGGPASAFDPEGTFLGGQLKLAFR
jgi:hypothetical protein